MADKNKTWLDRLPLIGTMRENSRLKEQLAEASKSYGGFNDISNLAWGGGQESSLFMETFMAGHSGKNYDANPRAMMETYKAIYYAFPIFSAAIGIRKRAMGVPMLVSDDKGMQNDLDWLNKNLPVTNWKNNYKQQKGLNSLKDRLYVASTMKGTAFSQVRRDLGGTPESVDVFRSEWFGVEKNLYHNTEFYFNSVDGRITIQPDGDFNIYSQSMGDWDWGIPIASGVEYFANAALRMIESRLNFEARIGNPPAFFVLTGDPRDDTGNVNKKIDEGLAKKITKLKESVAKGMAHSVATGRSFTIFDYIPSDVKLEHFTYGQGVTGSANIPEILQMFWEQMIYKTDVPDFLLQNAGAAGMGSDRYRQQNAQFQSLIAGDRNGIEPSILMPCYQWLISNRSSPKTIKTLKLEWDSPNTSDAKLEAETKYVSAQATQLQLLNIGEILNSVGAGRTKLLMQYLNEVGWDEAIANELELPEPQPQPAPGQA